MIENQRFQTAKHVLKAFEKPETFRAPNHMHFKDASLAGRLCFNVAEIDERLGGGLATNALHEVRCSYVKDIAPASAFVLFLLMQLPKKDSKIIWVLEPSAQMDFGSLYPTGLSQFGLDPERLTIIRPKDLQTAMWAADEAAACHGLGAVIFQLRGNPFKFDMTATRRLMLRAQQNNVFSCILRQSGEEEATASATRWHVEPAPSRVDEDYHQGIGFVRHILTLERNRNSQIGRWHITWNHKTRVFQDAATLPTSQTKNIIHRIPTSGNRSDRPTEMGQIVDFERAS